MSVTVAGSTVSKMGKECPLGVHVLAGRIKVNKVILDGDKEITFELSKEPV